jgi:hypothetical protein
MTKYLLAGVFAVALLTEGAFAQGVASDPTANFPNGPAGSESMTKTKRVIDSNGTVTEQSKSFDKSQSYTSGDGELSAHSTVRTNEQTTVTPPVSTTTSSSTTTTQETR